MPASARKASHGLAARPHAGQHAVHERDRDRDRGMQHRRARYASWIEVFCHAIDAMRHRANRRRVSTMPTHTANLREGTRDAMYLTQSLHRAVQQHPDRIAVRFGDRQRTFREFADRVARLAGALQKLGMQAGDRVAMLSLNSDRYLEYQMAVPWGGGVLNPCNIRWSAAEILYSLDDSGSTILLVDETFRPLVEQFRRDSRTLARGDLLRRRRRAGRHARLRGAAGRRRRGARCRAPRRRPGRHLLHRRHHRLSEGRDAEPHQPVQRGAGAASPRGWRRPAAPTCMRRRCSIWPTWASRWCTGSRATRTPIVPAFNAEAVLDTLERDRVTHALLVPTMIQMLVDHPAMQKPRDLSALQTIIYGASPISEAVLERAMAALPGVGFVQAYGMTELVAARDRQPGLLPHGRGPQARQAARGRPGRLLRRGAHRRRRRAARCRAARSARSSCAGPT